MLDGDGVANAADSDPLDKFLCSDTDSDTCNDCSSGTYAPASDGLRSDERRVGEDGTSMGSEDVRQNNEDRHPNVQEYDKDH